MHRLIWHPRNPRLVGNMSFTAIFHQCDVSKIIHRLPKHRCQCFSLRRNNDISFLKGKKKGVHFWSFSIISSPIYSNDSFTYTTDSIKYFLFFISGKEHLKNLRQNKRQSSISYTSGSYCRNYILYIIDYILKMQWSIY